MRKMTANELKSTRTAMSLDLRSMAVVLKLPYRTYQDYEYGKRGIPDDVATRAAVALQKDRQFMTRLTTRLQSHPLVLSEPDPDFI